MSNEIVTDTLPDRIYDTLRNKTFMITGGTGYLGKVCIENLLRSFDVARIYVLIRAKKGREPGQRMAELFRNPLFDKVRNIKGDTIFDKCVAISSDITSDDLALSAEDRLVLEKDVEILIHSAASVRFDESLKTAINVNTKGTYSVLELAKGMKRLLVFVYLSTAYCHPEEKELFEKLYKSKYNPKRLIELVDWLEDKTIEDMSKSILKDVPNTYVYSKALAEDLIASAIDDLPVIVLRPSIVMPVWKEPIPGWNDNINGPMGLLIAGGKGVCRSMHGNREAKVDFISVDAVTDFICIIAAYVIREGFQRRVFNICVNNVVDITWGKFLDISKRTGREKVSFGVALWAPGGNLRKNKFHHYVMVVLAQLIPALILDSLMWCFGYKPFLWRIQMRIAEGAKVLYYFTNNEWTFNNEGMLFVRDWLNDRERSTYTVDADDLDLEKYSINAALAARKYVLKEPDESLPRAMRTLKIMVWIDKICNVLLKVLLAYLFYTWILVPIYDRL